MGKDCSDIAFKDDGRLKLLIIVGTRPEVIRLSEVIVSANLKLTTFANASRRMR